MTTINYSSEDVKNLVSASLDKAYEKFREKKFEIVCVITEQVIKVDPYNANALQLLGLSYSALSRHSDAILTLQKCIDQNPQSAESLNDLALAHSNNGNYEEAIHFLEKAIALKPEMAVLHSNLGLQYRHKHDYENALKHFDDSVKIKREPTTLAMIGGCYGEMKLLDEAEKYIRESINLRPDFAAAHVDLASILKLKGRWEEGFEEYEWRFDVHEQLQIWKKIYDPAKRWKGENLQGKRIMVHTEQGHGDAIMFSRYLPSLKDMGAHVTLHCAKTLEPIFEGLAHEFYTKEPKMLPDYSEESDIPKYDFQVPLLSLPHTMKRIITYKSYIYAKSKFDLSKYDSSCKVGIVWAGNPQHPNDRMRSCKLEFFKDISKIPDIKLFSLMKDTRPRSYIHDKKVYDLTENSENMGVVDLSFHMEDFGQTAEIIRSLDIVVGVDTAVMHLAGAMGKPCILLLPWSPDWRWELDGDFTIWYSTMHILRQREKGNWQTVFEEAKSLIENFIK